VEGIQDVGVRRSVLLTEDGAGESQQIADELGIGEVYGECDTEKKLKVIAASAQGTRNCILYVYANGIETHSAADVDMRISQKAKFADAVVLPEDMQNIPAALHNSQRMCEVAKENALFAFIIKGIMLFLSMMGCTTIWFVIFMDIVVTAATMLNSIRVTKESLLKNIKR
jgi:Cd2+/Zn2+-exporting ATPase